MRLPLLITIFLLNGLMLCKVNGQIEYIGQPKINYINTHQKVWEAGGLYFEGRYGVESSMALFKKSNHKSRFYWGAGVRSTLYVLSPLDYYTAPTRFIKNSRNWLAFTFSDIEENRDTLMVSNSLLFSSNFFLALKYKFNYHSELIVQSDFFGATVGLPATASLWASNVANKQHSYRVMPTLFNYTLIGSNNHGSLAYSLKYRYWFNDRWGAFCAVNRTFIEYKILGQVLGNDRFRNRGWNFIVGVSYAPFYNKYKN